MEIEWACTFEHPEQGFEWCYLIQDDTDEFDWSVGSGPTPSAITGPDAAQEGAYFIYIEASSPRVMGDEAR